MRTILELWQDFEAKYSNHPTPFEDEIVGDGLTQNFQLTFYPIIDLASDLPEVYINSGTDLLPVWDLLVEGTDYTINYATGNISFVVAPVEVLDIKSKQSISARVLANHCKINLKQFIGFYNRSIPEITQVWPRRVWTKISTIGTDIEGAEYTQLDTSLPPFDIFHTVQEIYQKEDDAKHQVFMKRDNILMVDIDDNTPNLGYVVGPSDYFRGPSRKTKKINTPFWVRGILKYPQFDVSSVNPNTYLGSETYLDDVTPQVENMLMRIGIRMYQFRQHWSERMNASTLRISTMKEISGMLMGMSMDLQKHTAEFAPGKGTLEPLTVLN